MTINRRVVTVCAAVLISFSLPASAQRQVVVKSVALLAVPFTQDDQVIVVDDHQTGGFVGLTGYVGRPVFDTGDVIRLRVTRHTANAWGDPEVRVMAVCGRVDGYHRMDSDRQSWMFHQAHDLDCSLALYSTQGLFIAGANMVDENGRMARDVFPAGTVVSDCGRAGDLCEVDIKADWSAVP